jgi:threonine dehydrogenase-like Zn-dependent dehydrogenase
MSRSPTASPLPAGAPLGSVLQPSRHGGRPSRMMAAIWTPDSGHGCFDLREFPVPRPGPGQVRIKVEGCGVSTADFDYWEQCRENPLTIQSTSMAGTPGREAWGRIDSVGAGVEDLHPGERVAILSEHGFAEYDVADCQNVVRLPEGLDGQPFPARSLAGAVNLFRRCGINKGDTVAVVGIGFLGSMITQLAALSEATVIAIGRRSCSLDIAKCFGAMHTLDFDPVNTPGAVREITQGELCDIVIEAAGKPASLDLAAELTRERGRVMMAGCHRRPRAVNLPLWNERGLDIINAHEPSPLVCLEGMREAVAAVDTGLMTPGPLYTHRFPLGRLAEGLKLARERPEGFMKAFIEID